MHTLEAIQNRHSYRGQFLSTPDLIAIMEAGLAVPSGPDKKDFHQRVWFNGFPKTK